MKHAHLLTCCIRSAKCRSCSACVCRAFNSLAGILRVVWVMTANLDGLFSLLLWKTLQQIVASGCNPCWNWQGWLLHLQFIPVKLNGIIYKSCESVVGEMLPSFQPKADLPKHCSELPNSPCPSLLWREHLQMAPCSTFSIPWSCSWCHLTL